MADDAFTIEVNGTELPARPGQMLIEITDAAGIYVPRFCYHTKLSIAANCRMCLVDVENAPKPLPACATPVTKGMKVRTQSARALDAQRATMEFLLINHPLDCPICDQGGECELQDLAMGFGRDVSRFTERKRVVKDKDIGPLVSTDMTRCIHCTRCVRFGQEIAGIQELGTIGRGERMEISTYVERSIEHELSGNIIDLCPVGALNSKPYRFSARAWEMRAHPGIAPHDCFGSHLDIHVLTSRVKRVVPGACEDLNETWLSDRDRFSYEGLYSADRLGRPMLRDEAGWREADWEEALNLVAAKLGETAGSGGSIGAWVSPTATLEEGYLLQKILRHLGSGSIDHRLRQRDFRDAVREPLMPDLGTPIAQIDSSPAILVIGSDLRREVPLLAHRLRRAALAGTQVMFLNPEAYRYLFPVAEYLAAGKALKRELAGLVGAALAGGDSASGGVAALLESSHQSGDGQHARMAAALRAAPGSLIWLGHHALHHEDLAEIRLLAYELGRLTGAQVGWISEGPNAAGLCLAGALPHRGPGGAPAAPAGSSIAQMQAAPPDVLLLWNVEPADDCAAGEQAEAAARRAGFVVAFTPYFGDVQRRVADVALPIGLFAETEGTFVNVEGRWQGFAAAVPPVGDGRPGWKVLRVLGTALDIPGMAYQQLPEVTQEVRSLAPSTPERSIDLSAPLAQGEVLRTGQPSARLSMYGIDPLVRRARALQSTGEARRGREESSGSRSVER